MTHHMYMGLSTVESLNNIFDQLCCALVRGGGDPGGEESIKKRLVWLRSFIVVKQQGRQ